MKLYEDHIDGNTKFVVEKIWQCLIFISPEIFKITKSLHLHYHIRNQNMLSHRYFISFFMCMMLQGIHNIYAQTNGIEILRSTFNKAGNNAQKLDAALALCDQSYSLNIDTLYHYAIVSKELARETGDKDNEILANVAMENWLERKNLFDSALILCNKDLSHLSYDKDENIYAKVERQKCFMIMKTNRHKKALEESFNFLGEAEKHYDTTSQIFAETIIGTVYRNMEQTETALQWFQKADQITNNENWEKSKNEFGIYFLTGMMYNWKQAVDTSQNNVVSDSIKSISYLDRAIRDSRKYENLAMLARALNVKAGAMGNPATAQEEGKYVKEAKGIYDLLHDTLSMLNSISPLCFYYIDAGQPEKGIEVCKNGIKIVQRGNAYPISDLYEALGQCYKAAHQYENYANTLNVIISLKDTLYKKNSERDLAELNAKYEDQKKENIIISQKLDIASKKNTMYAISLLSALLLLSLFLIYMYYHKKQKEQKLKETIAIAAAEEAERKRISADLHDNIGVYAAAASSSLVTIQPKDEQSSNTLFQLKENIQSMIAQLNDSIWALNKKSLSLTSISDRFKLFVQKLEYAYPQITISVEEQIEEDRTLSSFQALHLFRMMQEALNNSLKHSKCHRITVEILSNKILKIQIIDDGKGMNAVNLNGNGINNLKLRAKESGWNVVWENTKDCGTKVIISSPVNFSTTN